MTIDISYYDQLNKLVCPFCSYNLLDLSFGLFKCYENHIKMRSDYDNHDFIWYWVDIYLKNESKIFFSRSLFNNGLYLYFNNESLLIPHFNIFDYSLDDLSTKIKQYLVFI